MKEFEVKFNLADSEYMTALRLVAGAVCNAHGLDVDTLEDFKVCVTESAIILKNCGFESARVVFCGIAPNVPLPVSAARLAAATTNFRSRLFRRSLASAKLKGAAR